MNDMMNCKKILVVFLLISKISFSQSDKHNSSFENVDLKSWTLIDWLIYERDSILWGSDYTPLDTSGKTIDKSSFLTKLISGNYLLEKFSSNDSESYYRLINVGHDLDSRIKFAIQEKAKVQFLYNSWEKQLLPNFNFKGLDGKTYDRKTLNGKFVIINCWFLNCKPCVEEIPILNKLVDECKINNDIAFLALTFDKKDDISKFLQTRSFDYIIIPDKYEYLMDVLKIPSYPTHIVLDKDGKIIKIVSELNELLTLINNKMGVTVSFSEPKKRMPPPPPPLKTKTK